MLPLSLHLSLNTDPANLAGSHQSYLIPVSLNIDEKRREEGRGRKETKRLRGRKNLENKVMREKERDNVVFVCVVMSLI